MRCSIRVVTLVFLAAVRLAGAAVAQAPAAEEAAVRAARELYARTHREQAGYRRVEREVLGLSLEGSHLVGLYRGGELRKIEVTHYGESGQATEEYYLDGGRLVFLFRVNHSYDRPLGRVVARYEHRYYFSGGRLVRWLDAEGRRVPPASEEFREREQRMLSGLQPLLRALAQPDSTYEVE